MINEPLSPNITYHDPIAVKLPIGSPDIECHVTGEIIQIQTNYDFKQEIESAFELYKAKGHSYPVTFNGLKLGNNDNQIGSERICLNSNGLASKLTSIIQLAGLVDMTNQGEEFVQVSKYFRVMKYLQGGEHAPHYDSDFYYPDKKHVTRYSLVMYLTDNESGELAFCRDTREIKSTDWDRQATEDEIYLKVKPKSGNIVLFPHTLCHSVLPFIDTGKDRMIIRGDLIFNMS